MNQPRFFNAANLYMFLGTVLVMLGLLVLFAPASHAASGAFTFSASSYSAGEGTGKVDITIKRVGGSKGTATVQWRTVAGTADFDYDYVGFPWTTLSFASGETQKVRTIQLVNDTLTEPSETFKVYLANPTKGTTLGSITSAVVTILDNDTVALDTTAPSVAIASPTSGATYSSAQTIAVAVSATDNVGVSKVELYDGAALLGSDSVSPYSFSFAISSSSNGSHSFAAKAYDAAGNSKTSSAVSVTVNIAQADVTAPSVSLTSPTNGSTYTSAQTVTVSASALDNVGVSKVEFYDGVTLKGTDTTSPYSYSWSITSAVNGSHSFSAKAYDAAGNSAVSASAAVTVNIAAADTTAPTVSLTSPAAGATYTSAQTLSIAAAAQDNVAVTKVEFYDGTKLLGTDTTSPFAYSWSVSSSANGTHVLTCKAYDAAGNTNSSSSVTVSVNVPVSASTSGPLRVFPGAEGFGTTTPAGRGGQVIKVTNLNDSGTGSLRAAVQTSGARIIVFEVSGTIMLSSDLVVSNPYVTIAGQTAPSPGITLRRGTFQIRTHDVLVQHLRIRVGDDSGGPSLATRDGLDVDSNSYNVVVDHCSISWGIDENVCIKHVNNVTLSNSILSEGLNNSYNSKGAHSKALLVAYSAKNVSSVKNFMAHNADRHPNFKDDSSGLSLNDLYYDFGYRAMASSYNEGPYTTTDPVLYSNVGCVYKAGPDSNLASAGVNAIYYMHSSVATPSKIYLADYLLIPSSLPVRSGGSTVLVNSPPVWDNSLTVLPSNTVESYVLANAGARPADRDTVDKRVVEDAKAGTGYIIDTPGQVGGWPTLQVNNRVFTVPTNPNGDDDGDGYTNVEEILHQMAAQVEGKATL